MGLPTILMTDVVRSAHQGDSHGGAYLIDLQDGKHQQVLDWNDGSISWEGRGYDRGLRGIAFYKDTIFIAASDELLVFDTQFKRIDSYKNKFFRHCHEIFRAGSTLYLTSTGFDSVLAFDLDRGEFSKGYTFRYPSGRHPTIGGDADAARVSFGIFDPQGERGPAPGDTTHINNVWFQEGRIFVSGVWLNRLATIFNDKPAAYAPLPFWTHNARPFRKGVLFNSTDSDEICYQSRDGKINSRYTVPKYPDQDLTHTDLGEDHARQAFGRGLCVHDDKLIIGSSSPSTVSAYELNNPKPIETYNLTMDVRNSPHGLEIWPF